MYHRSLTSSSALSLDVHTRKPAKRVIVSVDQHVTIPIELRDKWKAAEEVLQAEERMHSTRLTKQLTLLEQRNYSN